MAPTLKRRNIIDSRASRLPFQNAIDSYGKVSKAATPAARDKQKRLDSSVPVGEVGSGGPGSAGTGSKKRRREDDSCVPSKKKSKTEDESRVKPSAVESTTVGARSAAQHHVATAKSSTPTTPVKRKAPLQPKSRKVETPTRGARAILEAFVISKPIEGEPVDATSPASARPTDDSDVRHGLTALHDAFLKTLALHFAHHGTASPAEIRLLLPSIQRQWGRRRVEAADIRRVLGIQQYASGSDGTTPRALLAVADYGRGKLCVEYESSTETVLPVDALRAAFATNLDALHNGDAGLELDAIPLAPVIPANPDDLEPRGPSKGAQRLLDLKSVPEPAQAWGLPTPPPSSPASSAPATPSRAAAPAGRASALLDRIRAKEAHAAARPAPPSSASVARRAALMRLAEVIPVIDLMAGSKLRTASSPATMSAADALAALMGAPVAAPRPAPAPASASFTMAGIVQQAQTSLQNPIAKDEVERCVRLAAAEVVPDWISIREIGKVVAVVVRGQVGRRAWTDKVDELLDEC